MKKNKKLPITIMIVAIVVVAISGGTFAYWQWTSATNTSVTFEVKGATMTIDGGGNITTKTLAPAACYNTKYAIQRKIKVTATNDTTTNMTETIQLYVNSLTAATGHDALNSTNKASLQWALVRSNETQHAANTWLLTSLSACEAAATTTNLETNGTMLGEGTFSSVSTGSTITLYNKDVAAAKSTTAGASAVTTTDYYELYIWIDPDYVGTPTVGTNSTDALQDMTLNLEWKGSLTNTPT